MEPDPVLEDHARRLVEAHHPHARWETLASVVQDSFRNLAVLVADAGFVLAAEFCVDCGRAATGRVFEAMVDNPDEPGQMVPLTLAVCDRCKAKRLGDAA